MPAKMTSKERVLTAFHHVEPDRVPIDYGSNSGLDSRLKKHYGLEQDDHDGLREALGVDFRSVGAPYKGPILHENPPGRIANLWGIRCRWIEHESGGYWDYCDFPLKDATVEEIEQWPMPSPDDFDYEAVPIQCRNYRNYCIMIGGAGTCDIINGTGMIRSMEQVLMDLATDDPAFQMYVERRMAIELQILERALEAGKGMIDALSIGEDLGTQIGPMISLDLYRRQLRPRHQRYVDLAKTYGIPVMMHSCGSSSWAFDDFTEIGIKIVDTLQPEAANMQPEYLKKKFGDRLSFHGCISTAGPVAYGTTDDVVENVRSVLAIMKPGGGFALSPTHSLQDNSPTENVVAMYDAAKKYGVY